MEGKVFNVAQKALQADFYQVCFLIKAAYDGLPSPANFHSWGKEQHALGTMEVEDSNPSSAAAQRKDAPGGSTFRCTKQMLR